jgi:hypothetical protein
MGQLLQARPEHLAAATAAMAVLEDTERRLSMYMDVHGCNVGTSAA